MLSASLCLILAYNSVATKSVFNICEQAFVKVKEASVVAKPYVEKAWEQAKPMAAKQIEASKPMLQAAQVKVNELLQEAQKKVK